MRSTGLQPDSWQCQCVGAVAESMLQPFRLGAMAQPLAQAWTCSQAVEARLRDAERWLDTTADAGEGPETGATAMVVVDEEAFHRLPATTAIYRAARAQGLGDVLGAIAQARRALDVAADDDHFERGAATGFGDAKSTLADARKRLRDLLDG